MVLGLGAGGGVGLDGGLLSRLGPEGFVVLLGQFGGGVFVAIKININCETQIYILKTIYFFPTYFQILQLLLEMLL